MAIYKKKCLKIRHQFRLGDNYFWNEKRLGVFKLFANYTMLYPKMKMKTTRRSKIASVRMERTAM